MREAEHPFLSPCPCRQGAESSQTEVAASAILAIQMDDKLGGGAVQVLTAHVPLDPFP